MTTPCSMIFVFSVMEMDAYYGCKDDQDFQTDLCVSLVHSYVSAVIFRQAQDDNYGGLQVTEIHKEIKQERAT